MPLSYQKLEKVLLSKGFIPRKIFIIKEVISYIEVYNSKNADIFLVYIQSKYTINAPRGNDIYNIQYVEIDEDGHIPNDYGKEPDDFDLENQYEEVDLELTHDIKRNDLENRLVENYNHPVSLKDIKKSDKNTLREIFRQLRRLKLCVQNVKYKISIMFDNYLCNLRYDNTFDAFVVENYTTSNRQLYITLDLETLYEKLDSVSSDVCTIRDTIYRVMDKNKHKHARILAKMFDHKANLASFSDKINSRTSTYNYHLVELNNMLETTNISEKKLKDTITKMRKVHLESSRSGIHTDAERVHQLDQLEKKLQQILKVKDDVAKNVTKVRTKKEDIDLQVDTTIFDCAIMFDSILKKLTFLSTL